ncbi:Phosphotransferase enzyme family protein [Legionella santicrucis]|uniref:Phosphotransferase enzyme family protein n=1 Tax=Legionella santicrucis TaxID=45074 RepID=A0A0W0Y943_9GAMM|nr:phosphotransferase [Legionella santicrucis]KTD53469.1 Phosphotransferase enzyme family protein [Legionella santicrucis]
MNHIQWATEALHDLGYPLKTPIPEIVLETAWSKVYRFHTDLGWVYLKKVPQALALEPQVIKLLATQFKAHVPQVLAENTEHHCFLMQDAGIPLHDVFKQGFNADILIQTLQHYTDLQMQSADNIELFLTLGVPDWRLCQLPTLYRQLLNEKELLLNDGLTSEEITQLQTLDKKLVAICEQLAQYNIPDTFGHADFHDKNILINPKTSQTTLIDLGEVVITHPFFSFHNCLFRTTEYLKLTKEQYNQLQASCFKKWLGLESSQHIVDIIDLINRCWAIHAVLGEYRLIKSVESFASLQLSRQGRFAAKLRAWIEQ